MERVSQSLFIIYGTGTWFNLVRKKKKTDLIRKTKSHQMKGVQTIRL